MSVSLTPCDDGVRACRGFVAGPLPGVVFFLAEERIVAWVTVAVFSFADFEIFAAVAVPLGRVFAELEVEEVEDVFLMTAMLFCWKNWSDFEWWKAWSLNTKGHACALT